MEFFNSKGSKFKTSDTDKYYYRDGKLTMVPNMSSNPEHVYDYLEVCIGKNLRISRDDIREVWDQVKGINTEIISDLERRRAEAEGDMWRTIAYSRAIKAIKNLNIPILSGKQAMSIKGIGKGIASNIDDAIKKYEESLQKKLRT